MNIIDCLKVREKMLDEACAKLDEIYQNTGKHLKVAVIQVEGDSASDVYIKNKIKTCGSIGVECNHIKLPNNISYADLRYTIDHYGCEDSSYTACMLQLPLPEHLKKYEQDLLDIIHWTKDVDGLTTTNIGKLWSGQDCIVPCTPMGVLRLLESDLSGKLVVIAGRSNLVGKPLIKLLQDRNATVVSIHSKTSRIDVEKLLKDCDIFISAIGKPKHWKWYNFAKYIRCGGSYVKSYHNCKTIVDVGINRDENGKLCGDLDMDSFDDSLDISITPVPRGVGVLTTAQLMLNTIKCYELQN